MLSLASAAFAADKRLISKFEVNLITLPEAKGDADTMKWWSTQPEVWAACRASPEDPATAMERYARWVEGLGGQPVFVAYPAGFDFLFVYWYLIRFAARSPFGHAAIDIRSFAMATLRVDYLASGKKYMPRDWFEERTHTHIAMDDALEQGALFCNMLKHNRSGQ
jgi:hypothetical protein